MPLLQCNSKGQFYCWMVSCSHPAASGLLTDWNHYCLSRMRGSPRTTPSAPGTMSEVVPAATALGLATAASAAAADRVRQGLGAAPVMRASARRSTAAPLIRCEADEQADCNAFTTCHNASRLLCNWHWKSAFNDHCCRAAHCVSSCLRSDSHRFRHRVRLPAFAPAAQQEAAGVLRQCCRHRACSSLQLSSMTWRTTRRRHAAAPQ